MKPARSGAQELKRGGDSNAVEEMARPGHDELKAMETCALQLDDDMRFQRKTWIAERIAWAVIGVLLIAAFLGLFSSGLLSSATAEDAGGIVRVEYNRFERLGTPSNLQVMVAPQSDAGEIFRLRIGKEFADNFEISQIQPRPEEAAAMAEGLLLVFRVAPSGPPATIYLSVTPQKAGPVNSEIGAVGREPVRFTQFVYP